MRRNRPLGEAFLVAIINLQRLASALAHTAERRRRAEVRRRSADAWPAREIGAQAAERAIGRPAPREVSDGR